MKKHYTLTRRLPTILAVWFISCFSLSSGTAQPILSYNTVLTGLTSPVDIVNAGDNSNRLFIVQRGGLIRILSGGALLPGSFLNLSSLIVAGGEQGLLSMAFHPDYETNRYFFVYYTRAGDGAVTIARYRTSASNANQAEIDSGRVLLTIAKNPGATNHNGGKLNFGSDGYLYFATGDGGGGGDPLNNAQNGNALQGKMIRLDVNGSLHTAPYYTIPATNPYVSDPNVRDEIYALGLRNPWRWSFDRLNGNMWIGDVGQDFWEEVNFRPAGATGGVNYGWDCFEGNHTYNNPSPLCLANSDTVSPVFEYSHSDGFSITGGYVYRGALYPAMAGYYITTDFGSGNVWKIIPNGGGTGWNVYQQTGLPGNIVSYGESESGELYAVSLGGALYQVTATAEAPLPVTLLNLYATPGNGLVDVTWRTSFEMNVKQFDVEYSDDGIEYKKAGSVPATNSATGNAYSFKHIATTNFKDRMYYRLRTIDVDGQFAYSNVVTVQITDRMANYINPTVINNGVVTIYLNNNSFRQIEVVSVDGRVLMRQQISGRTGRIDIALPPLVKGPVMIRVQNNDRQQDLVQKVIVQ